MHGRADHGPKKINHGKVIDNILAGVIHKTCGTHQNTTIGGGHHCTEGSFTRDRWTQLTLLAHTITQNNLSVSSAVVNPLFYGRSKHVGESCARSASAKQKPAHCSGRLARKVSDKNADMDHHAALPPTCQAGGDSRRGNLCQHERVNKTTPGPSSAGQLEAAGPSSSRRLVAAEDLGLKRKFIFIQILVKEIHQEVRRSCKEFRAAERGGARIDNRVLNSMQGVSPDWCTSLPPLCAFPFFPRSGEELGLHCFPRLGQSFGEGSPKSDFTRTFFTLLGPVDPDPDWSS